MWAVVGAPSQRTHAGSPLGQAASVSMQSEGGWALRAGGGGGCDAVGRCTWARDASNERALALLFRRFPSSLARAEPRSPLLPPPCVLLLLLLVLIAQVQLPYLSGQALAHVGWGLACCDVRPPDFWLDEYCQSVQVGD